MSPLDRPRNLEPCYFTGFIEDSTIEMMASFRPHGSRYSSRPLRQTLYPLPMFLPSSTGTNRFLCYFAQTGHSHFAATVSVVSVVSLTCLRPQPKMFVTRIVSPSWLAQTSHSTFCTGRQRVRRDGFARAQHTIP